METIFLYGLLNNIPILYPIIILLIGIICYLVNTYYTKKVSVKVGRMNNVPEIINDYDKKSADSVIIEKFVSNYSTAIETPYIIGICGGSGSGKSFVTNLIFNTIKRMFPKLASNDIVILSQDNYYIGGNEDANYDIPSAIDFELLISHLQELINGNSIECPIYDFATHSRKNETKIIHPGKFIIVEGILIFTQDQLRKLFNMKIFIYASLSIQIFRRTKRDVKERGKTIDEVEKRYERDVEPSYHEFVFPSSRYADMFINNVNGYYVGHQIMLNHIIKICHNIFSEKNIEQ